MAKENKANIRERAGCYFLKAVELEIIRKSLCKDLTAVMHGEIIPTIQPLLPPDYDICAPESKVQLNRGSGCSVPAKIEMYLRLQYKGKPIFYLAKGPEADGLRAIQKQLKPKLEELARDYDISCINIFCRPLHA